MQLLLSFLALALLSACVPQPRPALQRVAPAMVRFHGEAVYRERMALVQGATLQVSLLEQGRRGTRVIAQAGGIPARTSPVPFVLEVTRAELRPGYLYALSARIEGPRGHVLWQQPAPAPVDASVAAAPVTLWLVRAAPSPRPDMPPVKPVPPGVPEAPAPARRGPANVVAEGRQPTWSARVYGYGRERSLHTSVGREHPLRQRYAQLKRQRLPSGVVVYTTADGFVSLTVSPGVCSVPGIARAFAWAAVLETPAASYRGCANGIP